jgi:hypothetical protein
MFGHALPLGAPDFCVGGVVVDGVVVVGVLDCVLVFGVVVAVAAPASAMPAAAPPVASAPAIMVAPRILEMVIGSNLLGVDWGRGVSTIVRDIAKPQRRGV